MHKEKGADSIRFDIGLNDLADVVVSAGFNI
jgi:hypothetical protein